MDLWDCLLCTKLDLWGSLMYKARPVGIVSYVQNWTYGVVSNVQNWTYVVVSNVQSWICVVVSNVQNWIY